MFLFVNVIEFGVAICITPLQIFLFRMFQIPCDTLSTVSLTFFSWLNCTHTSNLKNLISFSTNFISFLFLNVGFGVLFS